MAGEGRDWAFWKSSADNFEMNICGKLFKQLVGQSIGYNKFYLAKITISQPIWVKFGPRFQYWTVQDIPPIASGWLVSQFGEMV